MVTATKDNLQAHRFMSRRVHAALLDGDADAGERPLSRLGTGTYAGIFVTVALLAVAGIVGVLRPGGSNAWLEPGAFIVESETGARYVFLDDELHSVLNYSSARLLLGEQLHVVSVSVRSLESAPHGPPVGITSAPDSLPDAAQMAGSTWSVCAVADASDGGPFRTAIFPGRSADGDEVPGGMGYLLRTTDGGTFLVAQGHAFAIADRWLAVLGYRDAPGIEVGNDFVNSLPPGEPIAPLPVPGLGEQGPPLPGSSDPTPVGTVFVDRLDAHYVMTRAGLATLTQLQADLLLADPDLRSAYSGNIPTAVPISQARITEAALPPPRLRASAQAPVAAPTPAALPPGDRQLCVRYPPDGPPDIVVAESDPSMLTAAGTVQLSTGGGALVTVRSDTGAPAGGRVSPTNTSATDARSVASTAVAGSVTVPESPDSVGCDGATAGPGASGISGNAGPAPDAGAAATNAGPNASPGGSEVSNAPAGPADAILRTPPATTPSANGSVPAGGARNSSSMPGPMICLVTESGQRYPLAGARALQQLGLSGVSVAQLPAAVIGLLPIGPVLDPAAAAAVAP